MIVGSFHLICRLLFIHSVHVLQHPKAFDRYIISAPDININTCYSITDIANIYRANPSIIKTFKRLPFLTMPNWLLKLILKPAIIMGLGFEGF